MLVNTAGPAKINTRLLLAGRVNRSGTSESDPLQLTAKNNLELWLNSLYVLLAKLHSRRKLDNVPNFEGMLVITHR